MVDLSKIREVARQKGMSLAEVAKNSGCTPQTLSRIMRTNATDVMTLDSIANALGVSPVVFFGVEATEEQRVINVPKQKVSRLDSQETELIELLKQQNDVLLSTHRLLRKYLSEN